jgi:putative two-component system response regulator
VVDVFDALLSARPYKGPWQVEQSIAEIEHGLGSHFDPLIAKTFISLYNRGALNDLIEMSGHVDAKPVALD